MNTARLVCGFGFLVASAFRVFLPDTALSEESIRVIGILLIILGTTEKGNQ